MLWPLPLVCLASFGLGITIEIMMVQWTVAMARNIPPVKLARVSSYDLLGSVMAMPIGALIAGPLAAAVGVSATQYGAAALIVVASALALIPRDVRRMRADHALPPATAAAEVAELAGLPEAVVDAEVIPAGAAADAGAPVAVPSASVRG